MKILVVDDEADAPPHSMLRFGKELQMEMLLSDIEMKKQQHC